MYQEFIIGCLGSRSIVFWDAKNRGFWAVGLGTVFEKQVLVRPYFTVETAKGEAEKIYPIGQNWSRDAKLHRKTTQAYLEKKMSGITLCAEFLKHGVLCKLDLWHSFYPGDIEASTLPAFHCDVEITKKTNSNWVQPAGAKVEFGFEVVSTAADETAIDGAHLHLSLTTKVDRNHYILSGWTHRARNLEDREFKNEAVIAADRPFEPIDENLHRSSRTVTLEEEQSVSFHCTAGMYSLHRVMKWRDEFLPFRYQQKYSSAGQVVNEALQRKSSFRRQADFFDSCFENASLSKDALELTALGWHSYLMNTWWLMEGDRDRYFVWEGCCAFLSTVDVEYNISPLYLQLWPDLLKMQLIQWLDFVHDGVLCHDIGMMLTGGKMEYPHPMPVEENSNFLLMLLAYWKYTADDETLNRCFETACELSRYISDADTDRDGFVEQGTANTIDDGDVSVQYAPKQIYLGVKAAAAQQAFTEIAGYVRAAGSWQDRFEPVLEEAKDFSKRAYQAVAQTYDGRHFPVCAPTAGEVKFRRLDNFEESGEDYDQEVRGVEGCSIYAANGIVLLKLCGMDCPMDEAMLKNDLLCAREQTRTRYGHTHSSYDKARIWISQNMWSDIFSAYIGLDPRENMSRYALMQEDINSPDFGGQFTDTWSFAELCYYPRGITCIGLFAAMAGAGVNRIQGRITLNPPAVPVKVPLLFMADWTAMKCPWLSAEIEKGKIKLKVEGGGKTDIMLNTQDHIDLEVKQ